MIRKIGLPTIHQIFLGLFSSIVAAICAFFALAFLIYYESDSQRSEMREYAIDLNTQIASQLNKRGDTALLSEIYLEDWSCVCPLEQYNDVKSSLQTCLTNSPEKEAIDPNNLEIIPENYWLGEMESALIFVNADQRRAVVKRPDIPMHDYRVWPCLARSDARLTLVQKGKDISLKLDARSD